MFISYQWVFICVRCRASTIKHSIIKCDMRITLFSFFSASRLLWPARLPPSYTRTSDPGLHSRLPSPRLSTVRAFSFIGRRTQPLPSLVDSRQFCLLSKLFFALFFQLFSCYTLSTPTYVYVRHRMSSSSCCTKKEPTFHHWLCSTRLVLL